MKLSFLPLYASTFMFLMWSGLKLNLSKSGFEPWGLQPQIFGFENKQIAGYPESFECKPMFAAHKHGFAYSAASSYNCTILHSVLNCRHRIPRESWWLKLRPLLRILAKHETTYVAEDVKEHIEELESGTQLITWRLHLHMTWSLLVFIYHVSHVPW